MGGLVTREEAETEREPTPMAAEVAATAGGAAESTGEWVSPWEVEVLALSPCEAPRVAAERLITCDCAQLGSRTWTARVICVQSSCGIDNADYR